MLLIPFVENAFKHGIGLVEHPFIKISLIMASPQLQFTVTNNYDPANTSKDNNSGIGLENVRNRLKLLYPGRYKLDIQDKDNIYQVRLNLELTC
jgi:sensor histidine kinase YesM